MSAVKSVATVTINYHGNESNETEIVPGKF